MVSFWGQKNLENTLRIQSCYYISLQKSPIVASILSMGKKQPRRVHASAELYQILASNSDGVNATIFLTTDLHSSNDLQYQYALKCCTYPQKFSLFQFIYFIFGSFSIPFD